MISRVSINTNNICFSGSKKKNSIINKNVYEQAKRKFN